MDILIEPIETQSSVVKCDGGGGHLGHPAIFLNLGKEKKIVCPYCSKCFVKKPYFSKTGNKTSGLRRAS